MLRLCEQIARVASLSVPVLVTGETGTGKELVARALHEASDRAAEPFVAVNCAALPRDLIEAELFGYERGAFTGAHSRRVGRFEAAGGGTVLLDEVGDLPGELQSKLLRVLQERTFEPLGTNRAVGFEARIVAATSLDLDGGMGRGEFRADLFYRLAVVQLHLPPLRERTEDLPAIAGALLARHARREGRVAPTLSPRALEHLAGHAWPGNIRELENVLISASLLCDGETIESVRIPRVGGSTAPSAPDEALILKPKRAEELLPLREYERRIIEAAFDATGGNLSETARRLEIGRATLRRKVGRPDEEAA